jgi:alpha-tubulin suppressor-like RCC1 family protein
VITKISFGKFHSLLLSNDRVIYGFGNNEVGQIGNGIKQRKTIPTKLYPEKKFIDIVLHLNYNLSMALSDDNVFYVQCEFNGPP